MEQATSYSRVGEKTLKWLCQEVSSTGHLDLFSLTGSSFVHSYSYTVSPVSLKWLRISCFYNMSSSQRRTFLFKYFFDDMCIVGQRKEEHVHIWVQEPTESRRGCQSPLQLWWAAEWLFGRKLGPLKEQYVLLITKVSLSSDQLRDILSVMQIGICKTNTESNGEMCANSIFPSHLSHIGRSCLGNVRVWTTSCYSQARLSSQQ